MYEIFLISLFLGQRHQFFFFWVVLDMAGSSHVCGVH